MRATARGLLSITLLSCGFAGQSLAQTTYPNVKLTGRLQEQFYYFDNEAYASQVGPQSNIFTVTSSAAHCALPDGSYFTVKKLETVAVS